MTIDENNVIVISKDDTEEMKILSRGVVVCLEIISSFSIDGKYIPSHIPSGRMSSEETSSLYIALYSELIHLNIHRPKKLQKMKPKKLLKKIRPALPFVLGIYRNGTPDYRFQSIRVDESVTDDTILECFAVEFKKSIIQGASYITDFIKQFYGEEKIND